MMSCALHVAAFALLPLDTPPQLAHGPLCRRSFMALPVSVAMASASVGNAAVAFASGPASIAKGTIDLQKGAVAAGDTPALYVTVRPAAANGMSALQAGKVVPLATKRFAAPLLFPFQFELTAADLTEEYRDADPSSYDSVDLLVSARWDGDGVAATRGPDDLVGRGLLRKLGSSDKEQWSGASIELQGRGLAGRLLTGGSK